MVHPSNLYTNAAEVLPKELLVQVQRHWPGGFLWMPKASGNKSNRDIVLKSAQAGLTAGEAASIAGISLSQVYRIAKTLGANNPYNRKQKQ